MCNINYGVFSFYKPVSSLGMIAKFSSNITNLRELTSISVPKSSGNQLIRLDLLCYHSLTIVILEKKFSNDPLKLK